MLTKSRETPKGLVAFVVIAAVLIGLWMLLEPFLGKLPGGTP